MTLTLIKTNKFPNAFQNKKTGRWSIPINDVAVYEAKLLNSIGIEEAIEKLQMSKESVLNLIYEKKFPNCFQRSKQWKIPLGDIVDYQERVELGKSVSIFEAIKLLGLKDGPNEIIDGGYFPNAYKVDDEWSIPVSDIEEFKEKSFIVGKYMDLEGASNALNISTNQVLTLIKQMTFTQMFRFKAKWWISKDDIDKQVEKETVCISNTFTGKEVSEKLGYSSSGIVSQMIVNGGKFPNAFKAAGQWRIPVRDLKDFEKLQELSKEKVNVTPESLFEELKSDLKSMDSNNKLKETKENFLQFCLIQINNMGGTSSYRIGRVRLFKNLFEKLMITIPDEIHLVSSVDMESLFSEDSPLRQHEKKVLIVFLRYIYHEKNIKPEYEFSLMSRTKEKKQQDIYTPELFRTIYQYTKERERHIPTALKDRCYANMWVYTILLLTDFIRGQDLIKNTPNIDLEPISIHTLNWFLVNELTEYQAQIVINQLYTHFRYKRTSKTDELLTFVIAPDLIKPLATALIISELHRTSDGGTILLDSFHEGNLGRVKTNGKMKHRKFFHKMKRPVEFKFSSLMMNRSVATYLFYSVVEEDGQDSDLALHLTQVARSHNSSDTTSQYVQATNKDGSINRVSYNLFKRGHFGWLYNYLILYIWQFQSVQYSIEQRSKLIEQIRQEISPLELEGISKFINDGLSLIPTKNENADMEKFLWHIYEKRQSVISRLKNYSQEEVREIIKKLAGGALPSKNEHAQCLVYPNCKNPRLTNCFACEYVVPGNLMLIQLNEELQRIIKNIEDTTNDVILQKESKFLMHTLFIWKEARIELGDEKVKAYVDIQETWKRIENVAHKISIKS